MGTRRSRWPVLTMALALAYAGGNAGPGSATTNKPRKHVVVEFTDNSLHPSVARVHQGANVVWLNYTTIYTGAVVFPASIKDSFICSDLRPLFGKVAAGYQSEAITEWRSMTLPCPLNPGSYPYELRLFSGDFGVADDPVRTLSGKIVVE